MVKSGGEESFKKDFEKKLAALCEEQASAKITFFKKTMRNSKKEEFEEALFPGYLFLSAQAFDARIVGAAKKSKNFYRFLNSNTDIRPLRGSDLEHFSNLLKFGETQGVSKARFAENQRIVIESGPLLGFEGKIVKVNRKRGRATVQIDLCDNTMKFDLAFEEISAKGNTEASDRTR